MKLFCGDAICKKPVEVDRDTHPPWPIRCDACGTSLYPGDVLSAAHPDALEPKRGELMAEVEGRRVSVSSKELAPLKADADAGDADDVDRLMDMVEHAHVREVIDKTAEKKSARVWIILAVVVMVCGTLTWALGWGD